MLHIHLLRLHPKTETYRPVNVPIQGKLPRVTIRGKSNPSPIQLDSKKHYNYDGGQTIRGRETFRKKKDENPPRSDPRPDIPLLQRIPARNRALQKHNGHLLPEHNVNPGLLPQNPLLVFQMPPIPKPIQNRLLLLGPMHPLRVLPLRHLPRSPPPKRPTPTGDQSPSDPPRPPNQAQKAAYLFRLFKIPSSPLRH